MRKFHRWLAVFFGAFLFWIALTGVGLQVLILQEPDHDSPPASATAQADPAVPAGFVCPETMTCQPRRKPGGESGGKSLQAFVQHLHSGETFGRFGTLIGILSGLALLFFAISGLWMYVKLWRVRRSRGLKPGWFWN